MKNKLLRLVWIAVFITTFVCRESFCFWEKLGIGNTSGESKTSSKKTTVPARFKKFSYIDKQGIGLEAFHMLIPFDWQFSGGINWVLDNPGMPAVASFRVSNPKAKEEFEVFPNQPFFWTNNQMVLSIFPAGSRYFGNEIHPPVSPLEALKKIVVPRFRGQVTNLRIIGEQTLPELAKALGINTQVQPGISQSQDGAKIRIEYSQDGIPVEEEIYCIIESVSYSMQSINGIITNINWAVDYIFSFKAEKGKLDNLTKTFQTIIYSFKLNPLWFSKYNQVVEFLVQRQIQQIQNTAQLSRIISQTNNEISDMIMDSYNKRQQVNDKIADNFSQYIRGVDEYYDPLDQKKVELPNGYKDAWANSSGEYILSDDPNFNPNIGSTTSWQKMKRKE